MKWVRIGAVLSFLCSSIPVFAQFPDATGSGPTENTRASVASDRVSIIGRVISEDGTAPPEQGDVVLKCGTTERARADIDSRGDFSLSVNVGRENGADPKFHDLDPATTNLVRDWGDCELQAQVRGYTSEAVHLVGNADHLVDVGSIIVHPMAAGAAPQKFTVSVGSLEAPEKAKKAFEKGEEQANKGKWASACDSFKRAIQEYPRYALAWLELGRAQAQQNSFVAAQQSFHQAVSKDSHLMEAYVELARVAVAQKEWKELADATEHLVESSPNSGAQYWFLNGAANLNLGNLQQAENSAQRGLRLDTKHSIPQLEYLYGLTLAVRGDYKNAAQHLATYLQLSPHSADAPTAQAKLAEIQKLVNPPRPSHEVDFSLH
jgi:Tfp pilus assembly protein PilF